MYTQIYVDEKLLVIADHDNNRLQQKINDGFVFYDNNTNLDFKKIVSELRETDLKGIVILDKDLEVLKNDFFKAFKVVEAGGGIVLNKEKEILFIYRNKKWDLPKGKLEKGETIELCAQREVEEETGIADLLLKRKIGETYHIYNEKGIDILKISHWFYFTCSKDQHTKAQIEEGITEVKWVATKDIKDPMKNTFQNIKNILSVFFDTP